MLIWLAASFVPDTAALARGLDPDRGEAGTISRAIFAQGRLWLLSGDGQLTGIDDGPSPTSSRAGTALDLLLKDNIPTILTCDGSDCDNWLIRSWTGSVWRTTGSLRSEGDAFIAAAADNNGIVVLTSDRVIESVGDKERSVRLSRAIGRGEVSSMLLNFGQVHIGLNAGEWGGGVERVDRSTGEVTDIRGDASGGLCAGSPKEGCYAVDNLATEPWNRRCIVASIGFWIAESSTGKIVEICGKQVRPLYFRRSNGDPAGPKDGAAEAQLFSTVGFFSLAVSDGALWAASNGDLYRIDAQGNAQIYSLPRFANVGGMQVSFGSSKFAFVREFADPQMPAIIVPR